jgi:cytochrome c-type biogenesis protein
VQGGILAFIYALGLGTPLILISTFFSRLGKGSRFWAFIRGRGFELQIGGTTLYLHTTSLASGLLMVAMGLLLATGQLELISQQFSNLPFTQWWVSLESQVSHLFGL